MTRRTITALLLAATLVLAAAACGGDDEASSGGTTEATTTEGTTTEGTTTEGTTTGGGSAAGELEGETGPGFTIEVKMNGEDAESVPAGTFTLQPGTYTYQCDPHAASGMKGTFEVT